MSRNRTRGRDMQILGGRVFISATTCRLPHLEMSYKRFTVATVQCGRAKPLRSDRMQLSASDCLYIARFGIATEVVYLSALWWLHGWSHVKLLPSRRMFCVRHTTMHHFTVSLYAKPHRQGACVFKCNMPPALLAE